MQIVCVRWNFCIASPVLTSVFQVQTSSNFNSCITFNSLQHQDIKDWEPKLCLMFLHFHSCMCAFVSHPTVSVTSWRLCRVRGHSRSLGCLLLIQPASACSPTQFAIKTKFRALKPEGRWVSAQGTRCLATGGDRVGRAYLSGRGRCGEGECVHVFVCVCVSGLTVCWCLLIMDIY